MQSILLVEDEPSLRQLIANNLAFEGFSVRTASCGLEALTLLESQPADLVVLDLMLPDVDGFQVLSLLRGLGNNVPVLMLTARGAEEDRLKGLRLGADDYMVKPFSVLELVARIRAVLRRAQPYFLPSLLRTGPFTIQRLKRQVYVQGQSLNLTALEFRLVELLTGNPCVPFDREEIVRSLWGNEGKGSSHVLSVHIANLRKKLGESCKEECIVSVGRVGRNGYLWALPVHAELE